MANMNAPLRVPTSDPIDSWEAARGFVAPGYDPIYGPYVAVAPIRNTEAQRYQVATPTHAPGYLHLNPDGRNWQAGPQPYQSPWGQLAVGAPQVPRATPRYTEYRANPLKGHDPYVELIGAYAPRITSATDEYVL